MPVQIGTNGQPDFDQPIDLMTDCHRRIEHFLGILENVADQVNGGPLDESSKEAVRVALRYFQVAAPNHTVDEEQSLFPRLRAIDSEFLCALLEEADRLEAQHREAEQKYRQIESAFEHWMSCGSISPEQLNDLRRELLDLRSLYQEHIHFEETTLFPVAARLLDGDAIEQIGREMAERRGLRFNRPAEILIPERTSQSSV